MSIKCYTYMTKLSYISLSTKGVYVYGYKKCRWTQENNKCNRQSLTTDTSEMYLKVIGNLIDDLTERNTESRKAKSGKEAGNNGRKLDKEVFGAVLNNN